MCIMSRRGPYKEDTIRFLKARFHECFNEARMNGFAGAEIDYIATSDDVDYIKRVFEREFYRRPVSDELFLAGIRG